jgi:hypothetical protein
MAKRRLTDRTLRSLKPATDGKPLDVWDSICPGLGVRVMGNAAAPVRTFVLLARFPGSANPTRARIGSFIVGNGDEGKLSLEAARDKARNWQSLIRAGRDPRIEETRARDAAIQKQRSTFGAMAEAFIAEKLPSERRGGDVERDIRKAFAHWWPRPITEITDDDVVVIIKAKAKTAPAMARSLLGVAKRLFQWAIEQRSYGLKQNPAATIKPTSLVGDKTARDRLLSDDEVFAFWRASGRMPYPYGPVYKLLALAGLRLNEVAGGRRSELHPAVQRALLQRGTGPIDWTRFTAEELIWTIPASRMKGKQGKARAHVVPLTPDMLTILEGLPVFAGGDFMFSVTAGRTPVVMSTKRKADLDALMLRTLRAMAKRRGEDPADVQLEPWVNHDLRRVVRSGLSRLKIAEEIREAVLAHARAGIKGVYDQHDYLDEKRDALMQWNARLRSIVNPAPVASNVVALRG